MIQIEDYNELDIAGYLLCQMRSQIENVHVFKEHYLNTIELEFK